MFTHLLPNSNKLFSVKFTSYAEKHYLNSFKKKYKGKIWEFTELSIKEDLSRLRTINNTTQKSNQIDELKYNDNTWLAKYDFKIAGSNQSTKASGNRCILYININEDIIEILLIYNKTDIPKNKKETKYIMDEISKNNNSKLKELII